MTPLRYYRALRHVLGPCAAWRAAQALAAATGTHALTAAATAFFALATSTAYLLD